MTQPMMLKMGILAVLFINTKYLQQYIGGNGLFDQLQKVIKVSMEGHLLYFQETLSKKLVTLLKIMTRFGPKEQTGKGAEQCAYDVFLTTRRLPDATPIVLVI